MRTYQPAKRDFLNQYLVQKREIGLLAHGSFDPVYSTEFCPIVMNRPKPIFVVQKDHTPAKPKQETEV